MRTAILWVVAITVLVSYIALCIRDHVQKKKAKKISKSEEIPEGLTEELVKRFLETMCGHKRSHAKGEELTLFEKHWLGWRYKNGLPACPDCEAGDLCIGPSGGACVNLKCDNKLCGSGFNVTEASPLSYAERITDARPHKTETTSLGPN